MPGSPSLALRFVSLLFLVEGKFILAEDCNLIYSREDPAKPVGAPQNVLSDSPSVYVTKIGIRRRFGRRLRGGGSLWLFP
jgi:hypothetical protein